MNMIRKPRKYGPPPSPSPFSDDQTALARLIWSVARHASVREREAIAAVVMNRIKNRRHRNCDAVQTMFDVCVAMERFTGSVECLRPEPGDADYDCCCRIARRAIAGGLGDPTKGATRYHFVDACPSWSHGHAPSAWVGSRLFYRMPELNT
ncbi:MAG: cell wall hydrolase [Rhodospirillaceae bacterium]|jgi:N-acetylmuramoyl-L-alanine amidase|nr:cell wall hydrolase [Rhodospirillaceae bacterium]MBT5665643.1 cell wall hydrolase [Rhodospirillaceae bacterium]MBT5812176.1 cell wall hydrolase [Rhodospirillaceae bacterium]